MTNEQPRVDESPKTPIVSGSEVNLKLFSQTPGAVELTLGNYSKETNNPPFDTEIFPCMEGQVIRFSRRTRGEPLSIVVPFNVKAEVYLAPGQDPTLPLTDFLVREANIVKLATPGMVVVLIDEEHKDRVLVMEMLGGSGPDDVIWKIKFSDEWDFEANEDRLVK